jgi:hypothetical protein
LTMRADQEWKQRQRDDFNFPISDFLFTRGKSRAEPAYGIYISHLCPYHINSFDYAGSGNVISLYCFRFAPFVF